MDLIQFTKALRSSIGVSTLKEKLPVTGNIDDQILKKLWCYFSLLKDWNDKMDLIAPTDDSNIIERHLVDCIITTQLVSHHLWNAQNPLCDVGSGAGLPGLIFSILNPSSPVFLIEPREKRCIFLNHCLKEIDLTNTTVVRKRSEEITARDIPQPQISISRALGKPSLLSKLLLLADNQSTEKWCIQMKGAKHTKTNKCAKYTYLLGHQQLQRSLHVWRPTDSIQDF